MEHGMSERERLIRVEPLQKTRHQEGAHLVIGDVAAEISVDEVGYFVIIQASAVSLADDEFGGIQVRHFEMRGEGSSRYGCDPLDRKSTRLNSSHVAHSY